MTSTGKALEKLKNHPLHKSKPQNKLEKLAIELTKPEEIKSRFTHLLDVGQALALDIANDDSGPLHTLEFNAHHRQIKHETARACNLPIKLSLRKLRATIPLVNTFSSFLKFEYGPLHAALVVGDVVIEWGCEGIVEPRFDPAFTTEFQANIGDQGDWFQQQGQYQLEMSLADRQRNTTEKLDTLYKSMAEKAQMIDKLVDVIVDYNRNKTYSVRKCNCQHFARDAMAALKIKKPIKFVGRLQEHLEQLKKGNIKVPRELHSHENLDLYVVANKVELSRQDMEYLQCLYFSAHLPAIQKSDDPDDWECDIPMCMSAELDALIREHGLAFHQYLSEAQNDVQKDSEPTRSKPKSVVRSFGTLSTVAEDNERQDQGDVADYHHHQFESPRAPRSPVPHSRQDTSHREPGTQTHPCINDCGLFGNQDTAGLCSQCYRKEQDAARETSKQLNSPLDYHDPHSYQQRQQTYVQTTPPPSGLQDLPINESAVRCINDCGLFGNEETAGLCSRCYQKEQEAAKGEQSKGPETISLADVRLTNGAQVKCPTPGCEFFGTLYTEYYCSQCFDAKKDPPKCDQCREYFANKEYRGLCHACFLQNTKTGVQIPADVVHQHTSVHNGELAPTPHQSNPDDFLLVSSPVPSVSTNTVSDSREDKPNCYDCKLYFANEEYHGLCHGCFLQKTRTDTTAEGISRPPGSISAPDNQNLEDARDYDTFSSSLHQPPPETQPAAQKCYDCRHYFASEEYAGLCTGCFIQKTKFETFQIPPEHVGDHTVNNLPPKHQQAPLSTRSYVPRYEQCMSQGCSNPQTETGFCDICNTSKDVSPTGTIPPWRQQSELTQSPHPYSGAALYSSDPVPSISRIRTTDINDSLDGSTECFLCTKKMNTKNIVCRRHAEMAIAVVKQDPETPSPPSHACDKQPYPQTKKASGGVQQSVYQNVRPNISPIDKANRERHSIEQTSYQNVRQIVQEKQQHRQGVSSRRLSGSPPPRVYPVREPSRIDRDTQHTTQSPVEVKQYNRASREQIRKRLCVTPGCSFKGYIELDQLCPDCYENAYPDKKAPDHLPLV